MACPRGVLLLATIALSLGTQGDAVSIIYPHGAVQPSYPVATAPIYNIRGANVGGLMAPVETVPIAPVKEVAPLVTGGMAGLGRPMAISGNMANAGGHSGFIQNGQSAGGGGGFQQANGYMNQGASGGQSGFRSSGSYLGDDRHVGDKMVNSGYYNVAGMGQKNHQDGGLYESDQAFGREGKLKLQEALNNGYKNGHHSSGFQSSYHKDESGHNTRFYDDDHKEGQHSGAHNFGNFFDAHGLNERKSQGGQGQFQGASHSQQQQFGTGLHENAKTGQHNAHVNEAFYGQKNGFNQQTAGATGSEGQGNSYSGHSAQGSDNFNRGQMLNYHY